MLTEPSFLYFVLPQRKEEQKNLCYHIYSYEFGFEIKRSPADKQSYEQIFRNFLSDIFADEEIADKISLRFGVFADARQEADIEERFIRAKIAADRVKDDQQRICGFYDLMN